MNAEDVLNNIETGASLVSPTSSGGNEAIHKGNMSSELDAATVGGKTPGSLDRTSDSGIDRHLGVNIFGLDVWIPFEENSGTPSDFSTVGQSASISLSGNPTWISGRYGYGMWCDGGDDYITITGIEDYAIPNEFTAMVWCRSKNASWNDTGFIFSRRDQFIIHPNSSENSVNFYANTENGWENVSYTPSSVDVWHHYAVTYSDGTLTAYVDGNQVASSSVGTNLTSDTGPVYIGRDDGLSRYGDADFDDARLYKRDLNGSEITEIVNGNA